MGLIITSGTGAASGGGSSDWLIKTSDYTASAGDKISADTTNGSFNITLPASPSEGKSVTIVDPSDWSINNLLVLRNGSTIEGLSEDLILDVRGLSVELIYSNSTWQVTADASAVDQFARTLALID